MSLGVGACVCACVCAVQRISARVKSCRWPDCTPHYPPPLVRHPALPLSLSFFSQPSLVVVCRVCVEACVCVCSLVFELVRVLVSLSLCLCQCVCVCEPVCTRTCPCAVRVQSPPLPSPLLPAHYPPSRRVCVCVRLSSFPPLYHCVSRLHNARGGSSRFFRLPPPFVEWDHESWARESGECRKGKASAGPWRLTCALRVLTHVQGAQCPARRPATSTAGCAFRGQTVTCKHTAASSKRALGGGLLSSSHSVRRNLNSSAAGLYSLPV